ncbi:MAG: hypothetical protein JWR13_5466 [Mycobacterium sp.]|jgi:hypothetical protein|nr:hypothetical protein [Mycobacterium sp.]MCW2734650.1 hypothetical protein [Mycobacterium sp.]MDT5074793.1 hypothetical protein [Mycobacterium sp.]MDT5314331.1 hypothetical protein [Mycobacterium sp.]
MQWRERERMTGKQLTHWRTIMAKRGRKKRDRKHSKANHGKRPNCGSKAVS